MFGSATLNSAGADWKRFNETQVAARSNLVTLYANKKRLYDRAEFIKAALKDALLPLFALQVAQTNSVQ